MNEIVLESKWTDKKIRNDWVLIYCNLFDYSLEFFLLKYYIFVYVYPMFGESWISTFCEIPSSYSVIPSERTKFWINCSLNTICGISYRTYSAYKSHVYCHYSSLLYSTEDLNNNSILSTQNTEESHPDSNNEFNSMYDDIGGGLEMSQCSDQTSLLKNSIEVSANTMTTSIDNNERDDQYWFQAR